MASLYRKTRTKSPGIINVLLTDNVNIKQEYVLKKLQEQYPGYSFQLIHQMRSRGVLFYYRHYSVRVVVCTRIPRNKCDGVNYITISI